MASTIRRSIGDYEWIDEMKIDGESRTISSSTLEIIEQGDVAHVLDFNLSTGKYKTEGGEETDIEAFVVKFKYLNGRLEKDILLSFELFLQKQTINGDFQHISRMGGIGSWILISKGEECLRYYALFGHEFLNHAKVIKIILNLSFDHAKPMDYLGLTDKTAPTLEEAMKSLCLNDDLSDMKIVCDGTEFPCHKLILSARSDVFKAMFKSDLKFIKNEEYTLEILDISAETMKTFLQFIYKDDVEVEDIDQNLLIAADK